MRRYVLPLVLLVLAALGLWWYAGHGTKATPVALPLPSAESAPAPRQSSALEATAPAAREETALPLTPREVAQPTHAADSNSATIRVRFLDATDKAIARVVLNEVRGDEGALGESDSEGRIEALVHAWASDGTRVRLEARHPEYAPRKLERVVHPGEQLDLGDVRLERGGVVLGRVVDAGGRLVADAGIQVAPAGNHNGPERMKEGPYNGSNSGVTDERGQFRLTGIPAGDTRVWACRGKPPWSFSEPFPVRAGEETRGLELVLEDAQPAVAHNMRFLVRTPEREPAPGVVLTYRARADDGMSMGTLTSDEEGVVDFDLERQKQLLGGKIDVDAQDPKGRYGSAALLELTIAVGDHELALPRGRSHRIMVQAADGTPIPEFRWRMLDRARTTRPEWTRSSAQPTRGLRSLDYFQASALFGHGEDLPHDSSPPPSKPLTVTSGELPFVVQIDAPGFERAEAGPFTGAGAPDVIAITLEPLPELRGIVVHAEKPVAAAALRLLRANRTSVNGFPSRVDPLPLASAQSDAEGRFRLPLRDAGTYVVQAQSAEFGASETDPMAFVLAGSRPELRIEILDPGRIEGRLLLPADAAGEEWIVGASRGDGKAFSCRASHEGAFHFEKLAPGRWMLHALEREIASGEMSWGAGPGPSAVDRPWPYEVRSSETTRVEIDLRQEAELTSKSSIPGWEGGSWHATLTQEGATFGSSARASGAIDGSEFQLKVRPPGNYRLMLSARAKDGSLSRNEFDTLTLTAGTQSWSLPSSLGSVVLVNPREVKTSLQLSNEIAPGRSSTLYVPLAARSELAIGGLVPGTWRVSVGEDMHPVDAGSFVLQPGGTVRFERP